MHRQGRRGGSRRLLLDRLFSRLRSAARALGERRLDLLDRLGLGHVLDRGDFPRQPVERGFVKLPLAVGLLGLRAER